MKKNTQVIDYGIYIDHLHAFLVSINNDVVETLEFKTDVGHRDRFPGEGTTKTKEGNHVTSRESKHQDKLNEDFIKFCKSIIEKIDNANRILVMGPSTAKFELQKEIRNTKHLEGVFEELKTTDKMSENEILSFVKDHFSVSVR